MTSGGVVSEIATSAFGLLAMTGGGVAEEVAASAFSGLAMTFFI